MEYKFLNVFLEKKDLLAQNSADIDPFLLKNNEETMNKIYDFYSNPSQILFINGFMGTGKVQVANYSTQFLSEDTIVLKYNCFESTSLDDILLSFFNTFKRLTLQKIISEPKIKSENFNQKINNYFSSIEKPFVIILDSYEALSVENRADIQEFVFHISKLKKIKTIIISRIFDSSYVKDDISYEKIKISPLEKGLFEKCLKSNHLNFNNVLLEDFYTQTRGYYFYTNLSLKIMQLKDLSLSEYLSMFKTSFLSYYAFLERESLALIPATARDLFWTMSMIRHGVSIEFLKTLPLYSDEKMRVLKDRLIVVEENELLALHDYFRDQVKIAIAPNIEQKLHQYILDVYNKQLPLKPLERAIQISRQTIRKEIEYHNSFLPKTPQQIKDDLKANYLAYAKGLNFDLNFLDPKEKQESKEEEEKKENTKPQIKLDIPEEGYHGTVTAEVKYKDLPFELSEEEMKLLDDKTPPENLQNISTPEIEIQKVPEVKYTLLDYLNKAKEEEKKFNYNGTIHFYQEALKCVDDENYSVHLPVIYTKMAFAYQKLSNWDSALENYKKAREIYENEEEPIKANYIKLSIAGIYYENYKLQNAKELLTELVKNSQNPAILRTKAYISLANLEDSLSHIEDAYMYYKKAMELSNDAMDTETLSELYFKYALLADDKGKSQIAIEYYEKCISLSDNPDINKYLSSAYSNIGTLYLEKSENGLAVKNFLRAYEIDENARNLDGMYFSAGKLAQILQRKYPEKALEYYKKAFACAQELNDIFYIASSALAIGDFYYNKKQDDIALSQYLFVLDLVQNDFSRDNLDKINMRINDIKFRIGADKFNEIEKKIRNGKI